MGKIKIYIIALCVFIGNAYCAMGQIKKFELSRISQAQNLPGLTVRQLFQDSRGLLWIGVESYGLCKYDGYDFELYTHTIEDSTSISNNVVEALCEDKDGNIWAGTQNGLNIFNRKTLTFRTIFQKENSPNHISGNAVTALLKSKNGIWVGTNNGFVHYSNETEQFTHYTDKLPHKTRIQSIADGPDSTVWIASSNGIYIIGVSGKIQEHITTENSRENLVSNNIHSIKMIDDSTMLIGSNMQLYSYNPRAKSWMKHKIISHTQKNTGDYITDIEIDRRKNIWVSTTTDGISVMPADRETFQNFTTNKQDSKGLMSNAVRDIMIDKNGLVWFGLKFEGIQYFSYKSQTFRHYYQVGTDPHTLSNKNIISISESRDGKIWIGTGKGGINIFSPDSETFSQVNSIQHPEINNARINAFAQAEDGTMWVATAQFLYKINPINNFISQVYRANIIDLLWDGDELWIGTTQGMKIYSKGVITSFEEWSDSKLLDDKFAIKTIYSDSKGSIWIGTLQDGLFQYDKNTKQLFAYTHSAHDNKSISGNLIRDIHEDRKGQIWISTRGEGLNCFTYSDSTFTRYTERNGLPTNTLFGILEDSLGNLWISSYQGISQFDPSTKTARNFTKEYGLQNDIFEPNASCRSKSGEIYFGGDNGFNRFRPENISKKDIATPIVLTSVKVFDDLYFADLDSSTTMHLAYDENLLSFDFSLLDYSSNIGKEYRYKLEGFDKGWQTQRNRHFANYTNLEPGSYIFKVEAKTKDGTHNSNQVEVHIRIEPPLWKKVWFRILVALTLASLIYAGTVYKIRQERKQRIKLEFLVNKKTEHLRLQQKELIEQKQQIEENATALEISNGELQKANTTKNTLISVIAHDLKNQFQSVISLSKILENLAGTEKVSAISKKARLLSFTSYAINDVLENLLVWYKSQYKSLTPQITDIELAPLVKTIANNYSLLAVEKKTEINIVIPENAIVKTDKHMFSAIMRNLINNAVKHTNSEGVITIKAEQEDNSFIIKVIDNGVGLSQEQIENLFMFGKAERNENASTGMGLQICKTFADKLNCQLQVESNQGDGCTFSLSLPNGSQIKLANPIEYTRKLATFPETPETDIPVAILRNKRILIIDDNDILLSHLKEILLPYATVQTESNGNDGLSTCKTFNPNLIITDLMMPGLNGIELSRQLKADQQTAHIPIILLTGQNYDPVIEDAYKAGITDFIAKPFDETLFILKIKSIFHLKSAITYKAKIQSNAPEEQTADKATFLDKAIQCIHEQPDFSNFTVETLAENMNMSKSTLVRKLKSETMTPPSEIINEIRFERAKQLLNAGEYSISEIAWMTGFNEAKYFSIKFKARFGMTPRSFKSHEE